MKTNAILFWIISIFFFLAAIAYTIWRIVDVDQFLVPGPEWVGSPALALVGVLFAFVGFWLTKNYRSQGGELPEDRSDANIDDGDPELGHFSPWSWWPLALGSSAALVFLGLAVGFWISFIGVAVALVAIVGWTFEYYRGYFGR